MTFTFIETPRQLIRPQAGCCYALLDAYLSGVMAVTEFNKSTVCGMNWGWSVTIDNTSLSRKYVHAYKNNRGFLISFNNVHSTLEKKLKLYFKKKP